MEAGVRVEASSFRLVGEPGMPQSGACAVQQGLLSPVRGHNGYRAYDTTDVIRAGNVKELLDLGLTTADVQQYLAEGCLDEPLATAPRCSAELETVNQRLASLDELITRLQGVRDRLAEHSTVLEHKTRHH